jgi:hypothetical protein
MHDAEATPGGGKPLPARLISAQNVKARLRFARRQVARSPEFVVIAALAQAAPVGKELRPSRRTLNGIIGPSGLSIFDFRQVDVEALPPDSLA